MCDAVAHDGRVPAGELGAGGVRDGQSGAAAPMSAGEGEECRWRRRRAGQPFSGGLEAGCGAVVVGFVELGGEIVDFGLTSPGVLGDVEDSGGAKGDGLVRENVEERSFPHGDGSFRCSEG